VTWLPAVVTVEPLTEPVSLAEAKAQCRVDGSDSDDELALFIQAAREFVETYTGTKLVSQTVVQRCSSFNDLGSLSVAPVISVSSIAYLDSAGAEQTLSTDVYETVLTGLEPLIRRKIDQSWPSVRCVADAVRVTAVCGYTEVPAPIKHAMLLLIGQWFDNRSDVNVGNIVNELPNGVAALLSNFRRF
jgi:uncharacterized phiE125 gp8 family phage protein